MTNSTEDDNTQTLTLYPLGGEYIASIDYQPANKTRSCQKVETVVILDRSGSMGESLTSIVNKILPLCFQKLSYDLDEKIHLITFESRANYYHMSVQELMNAEGFYANGGTYMSLGIQKFEEIFKKLHADGVKFLRILAISDGEVGDGHQTIKEAEKLAEYVRDCEIAISSRAVRWFTSSYEPDTTALCCLLQLNNIQASKLMDIKSDVSYESAATMWANLFEDDGLFNSSVISTDSPIILKFPWDLEATDKILLVPGKNTFWLKEIPKTATIDDQAVNVEFTDTISYQKLQNLLHKKVDFIIDQMKILKIVESSQATVKIEKILEYFKKIEREVPIPNDMSPSDSKELKNRIKLIKHRTNYKQISTILAEIANDNMVHKLNAAQKAEYLRQVTVSKNSKSLAKRSAKCTMDLDFDEIARKEALRIANNFHEIEDIDDSKHEVSFYSQATTLEGIRTLIDFTKDEAFENASVFEILQLLNIVGVVCNGPIGDYPDASTWRINEIFPSCFISFADILCVLSQSSDNKLCVPAYDAEITNSIPLFDDPRIGKFLKRYAPSLLEFTFSIGMRKVIAEVPKTIEYTMVAGVRKMIDFTNHGISTRNAEIFRDMVIALENFAGKFEADEFMTLQKCGNYGFYLDNSGISEMIVPLIRVIRRNNPEIIKQMPAILRSIYNYEVWLSIRRNYKGVMGSDDIIQRMLVKLLGIDEDRHKINVDEPTPDVLTFYDEFEFNYVYAYELISNLKHLNMVALVPSFLHAAINGPLDNIRSIPALSSEKFLEALEIDYSFRKFTILNIFQALRYTTKQDRCDTEKKMMKIIDLQNYNKAIDDVKSYVRSFFKQKYEYDMARKKQLEDIRSGNLHVSEFNHERYLSQLQREPIYAKMAVKKILESKSYEQMIENWQNSVEWNGSVYRILNAGNFGFRLLKFALCTFAIEIPMRSKIIKTLMLGVDDMNKVVWNFGTAYTMGKKAQRYYQTGFLYDASYEEWDKLLAIHYDKVCRGNGIMRGYARTF